LPKVSPAYEQRRREQILEAAMACFAQHGYRATSMEDIVHQSGLSVGAIYTYFPSKEELFLALADQRSKQVLDMLGELFRQPVPMAYKAQAAVDYFFQQLATEDDPYTRASLEFWSEASKSDRLRVRHAERCGLIRQFFHWVLSEAQHSGELRPDVDVPAVAELLMALHDGLMMLHLSGVRTVPLDALRAAYVALVNTGLSSPNQAFLIPLPTTNGHTAASPAPVSHGTN
jgi:AcrR family transcriptional regulator